MGAPLYQSLWLSLYQIGKKAITTATNQEHMETMMGCTVTLLYKPVGGVHDE